MGYGVLCSRDTTGDECTCGETDIGTPVSSFMGVLDHTTEVALHEAKRVSLLWRLDPAVTPAAI